MTNNSTKQSEAETAIQVLDDWFDPIEAGLRDRVREFIQAMIEGELEAALSRPRYARRPREACENADGASGVTGHRHGHRSRSLLGTFGRVEIAVPRARLDATEGRTTEWKSTALRAYQRRTKQADSLIAGAYLAGTNTRRVRRALTAVFGGAVSKDTVSRVWRKVKGDWDAWNARSLAAEPIIRLILEGLWCGSGSTGRPPQSCFWSCSACVRTATRCCWPSRTWVARPARLGVRFSTIWSSAGCAGQSS